MTNDFQRNAPLIGGKWLTETSLGKAEHVNPADNRAQAEFHVGGAAEINAAVAAAVAGQAAWAATPGEVRRDILLRWAALIEANSEQFTRLAALESGVPVMLRGGTGLGLHWLRYYAGWADKISGDAVAPIGAPGLNYTLHQPYGVVGLIIPWNSPMVASCMKV